MYKKGSCNRTGGTAAVFRYTLESGVRSKKRIRLKGFVGATVCVNSLV